MDEQIERRPRRVVARRAVGAVPPRLVLLALGVVLFTLTAIIATMRLAAAGAWTQWDLQVILFGGGIGGWALQDTIPIGILGGREQGFRGYGTKTRFQPGSWKVQIETTDAREIGRIYFSVENAPAGARSSTPSRGWFASPVARWCWARWPRRSWATTAPT